MEGQTKVLEFKASEDG